MNDRGAYRPLYASFFDDADVKRLSHLAYRVLTVLKGTLPTTGIGFVRDDVLAERCACGEGELRAALAELEAPKRQSTLGWIVRDRYTVWVVNGLKFEPNIKPTNAKHRRYVQDALSALAATGPLPILQQFRRYYTDWFPGESRPATDGGKGLSEGVSDSPSDRVSEAQQNTTQTEQNSRSAGAAVVNIEERRKRPGYLTRCVIALNSGMQRNPRVTAPREIATSSQAAVVTWEEDGIDVDVAAEIIAAKCEAYQPSRRNPQITSLKYFDNAIRERWDELTEHGDVARAQENGRTAREAEWARQQHYTF